MKIKRHDFSAGLSGVVVVLDNGETVNFHLWSKRYFNDNGKCVSAKIIKVCLKDDGDEADGCITELYSGGKYTGEKRFFAYTDVVLAKVGDKAVTCDGVGRIEKIKGYSDFYQFGIRFEKVPERLICLVEAGNLVDGLVYYSNNEVDLIVE